MHELKHIMKKIYDHKMNGVIFHSDMVSAFDFLHLKGFKRWQEYVCEEEVEATNEVQHCFIKHHKMMLDPYEGGFVSDVIPKEWYSHSALEVDAAEITKHTKRLMHLYHDWEKKTLEFLKEMNKELIKLEAYTEYIEVKEICEDVYKELHFLEDFIIELESVGYDAKYIMKVQERFCVEFGK